MKKVVQIVTLVILIFSASYSQPKEKQVKWSGEINKKEIKQDEKFVMKISAKINSGWHLYSTTTPKEGAQPTEFTIKDKSYKIVGKVKQSTPIVKFEELFGANTEYYADKADFEITAQLVKPSDKNELVISVEYMMCNDKFCVPPVTDEIRIPVAFSKELIKQAQEKKSDTAVSAIIPEKKDTSKITPVLSSGVNTDVDKAKSEGLLSYIGFAMMMGALALLTPCVFPMVPITVSFFTKREQKTRKQGVKDALIYSFGIIFTFVVIGFLLALAFGASGINQFAANPWVNIFIAGIFIVFALNLFGAFEIALPSSWLSALNQKSSEGSGTISILLMGLTFSLTSFTCTVPFIGTIMVAAAKGDWLWPIIGMLAYATVFSLPFFLLALFPMFLKSMPKSGGWLNSVKVVMGFLEIAAAMKFLSNTDLVWKTGILTFDFFVSGWIAISILIVFYLLGKIQLPHDTPVQKIGVIRLLFSMWFLAVAFYLLGGLFGNKLGELDAFLPPREYPSSITSSESGSVNKESESIWLANYDKALELAKKENKSIFIDFTGYTCTNCRWMEANIFTNPVIKSLFSKYILVRLYTDGQGDEYVKNRTMQEDRFGTIALPFYVIVNKEDKMVSFFPGLSRNVNEFKEFLEKGLK